MRLIDGECPGCRRRHKKPLEDLLVVESSCGDVTAVDRLTSSQHRYMESGHGVVTTGFPAPCRTVWTDQDDEPPVTSVWQCPGCGRVHSDKQAAERCCS